MQGPFINTNHISGGKENLSKFSDDNERKLEIKAPPPRIQPTNSWIKGETNDNKKLYIKISAGGIQFKTLIQF